MEASHGRSRTGGRQTILHLSIETDDPDVLERIRAALPDGCRLHVRPVTGRAPAHLPPTDGAAAPRKRDILRLLMRDLSNKEIGRQLGLSHFTVRNHVSQVLRTLGAPSRKAAMTLLAEGEVEVGTGAGGTAAGSTTPRDGNPGGGALPGPGTTAAADHR